MSRQPYIIAEITLERCSRVYGVAPCTAAIGVSGSAKCYNTYATCQDRANFASTPHVIRLVDVAQPQPLDLDALPLLARVDITPTRIDREAGLGPRETVKMAVVDTTHNDVGFDDYRTTRAAPALATSTLWPRLLARNPYWHRRPLTIRMGWLVDGDFVEESSRHYQIDRVDGPDAKGQITITAKDVLALVDDDRVKVPAATGWTLAAGITNVATSATLVAGATGPTSGTLTIGDEACTFTRSGDTLTLTRGQLATVAEAHDAGDSVQVAHRIQGRIDTVLAGLLTTAGIDPAWLPTTTWDTEADTWAPEAVLDGWITSPTGLREVIKNLCQQTGSFLWWDTASQSVQLRFLRPGLTSEAYALNSDDHLVATGLKLTADESRRLTEVWYYHGLRTPTTADPEAKDFANLVILSDSTAAADDGPEWRAPRIQQVLAHWVPASSNLPTVITSRLALAYRSPPLRLSFQIDAKDSDLRVGGYVRVTLRGLVAADGTPKPRIFQVLEMRPLANGHAWDCTAEANGFDGRYAVQMADGQPDYATPGLDPAGFQSDAASGTIFGDDPYLQS